MRERSIWNVGLTSSLLATSACGGTSATSAGPAEGPPSLPARVELRNVGFSTPESVVYDVDNDVYYVSNINGSPMEEDDNGFISRVTPDGKVDALKWIDGASEEIRLDAPKGMAVTGGRLFVSDLRAVRVFDVATGHASGEVAIADATFLNDVAAGADGSVYVTDSGFRFTAQGQENTGTDAIYRIDAELHATLLMKSTDLKNPNGIVVDGDDLYVAMTGAGDVARLTLPAPSGAPHVVGHPAGGLDGLVLRRNGNLLVSSWETSSVYEGSNGTFEQRFEDLPGPADIGYDSKRDRLLIPLFNDSAVILMML